MRSAARMGLARGVKASAEVAGVGRRTPAPARLADPAPRTGVVERRLLAAKSRGRQRPLDEKKSSMRFFYTMCRDVCCDDWPRHLLPWSTIYPLFMRTNHPLLMPGSPTDGRKFGPPGANIDSPAQGYDLLVWIKVSCRWSAGSNHALGETEPTPMNTVRVAPRTRMPAPVKPWAPETTTPATWTSCGESRKRP